MSDFRIKTCVLGPVSTNCYLVYNEDTKEAVVIDPGDNGEYILNKCSELGIKPQAVQESLYDINSSSNRCACFKLWNNCFIGRIIAEHILVPFCKCFLYNASSTFISVYTKLILT